MIPSAAAYYAHAIEAMREVQTPAVVSYDVKVHVRGLGFFITRDKSGEASMQMPLARGADATFSAAHRGSDGRTLVQTPDGWGTIRTAFFNPTWDGVNDWIRYGFNDPPHVAPQATPSPEPSGLPVIAAVRAMGIAYYNVSDGGAATCANGDPAHRVHLIARKNPLDHPLTDAVIDQRTNRICTVRFAMHQSVVAAGYSSSFELNIGDVNGVSLVQGGNIDLMLRAAGVGLRHITVSFVYDHFAFPSTLP